MPQLYDQNRDNTRLESHRHSGRSDKSFGHPMIPSPCGRIHYRGPRRRSIFPSFIFTAGLMLIAAAALLAWGIFSGHTADDPLSSEGASQSSPSPAPTPTPPLAPSTPAGNNVGEINVPDWVTQNLLPVNEYSRPGDALPQVNGVVVHYVGNPGTTAKQNRSFFANLAKTHETYASSHFLIGIDGAIIQCVPLNEISYCSNHRNADTIAIECCHPDDTGRFTQETTEALIRLLNWLIETYGLERENILRHHDVNGKDCPKYFVQNPKEWEVFLDRLTFGKHGTAQN